MKLLKFIGITVLMLMVAFFGVAAFLPAEIHIERSVVVSSSPSVVFKHVNDLREWRNWSPWHKTNSNMKITYKGPLKGEGASYRWESEKIGAGNLTITDSRLNQYIATDLNFMEEGDATGYYQFEPVKNGTLVTWSFQTDIGDDPFTKYMGLMMDNVVRSDFDRGLQNLKSHIEDLPSQSKMMTKESISAAEN